MYRAQSQIIRYADLYGWDIVLTKLKEDYTHFSRGKKTQPKYETKRESINVLKNDIDIEINAIRFHRDGSITLFCKNATFRFWRNDGK